MFKKLKDKIELADITRSSQLPDWHFVRLTNYNYRELSSIKEWLQDNVLGRYKRIGWNEACPYEVGVLFEDETDAMAYKLTWVDDSGTFDYYGEDPLYDEDDEEDGDEVWV